MHGEERYIEIDVARGLALSLMIALHVLWDLDYYSLFPLNNALYETSKIVSISFFFIAGIGVSIAYKRKPLVHILKHGLWIFNVGMGLTIITIFFIPERPIIFGVLHCIGLSLLISVVFLKIKKHALQICTASAASILVAGIVFNAIPIEQPSVPQLVMGLHQKEIWRYTIDYFPILPWFGVMLIGITAGNLLYKDEKRQFNLMMFHGARITKYISLFGKNSLYVYLVHQPIIIGIIKYILPILRPILNF